MNKWWVVVLQLVVVVCSAPAPVAADAPRFVAWRATDTPDCAWADTTQATVICRGDAFSCRLHSTVDISPVDAGLEQIRVCVDRGPLPPVAAPTAPTYAWDARPPAAPVLEPREGLAARVIISASNGRILANSYPAAGPEADVPDDFAIMLIPGPEDGCHLVVATAMMEAWGAGTSIVGWSPRSSNISVLLSDRQLTASLQLGLFSNPEFTGCTHTYQWSRETMRYEQHRALPAREVRTRCQVSEF